MRHNLKTLLEHTCKHYPQVCSNDLRKYCEHRETSESYGFGSLKWFVYSLQNYGLSQEEIQDAFFYAVVECNYLPTGYSNIIKTRIYHKYQSYFQIIKK